jgi:hypothetical protein
MPELVEVWSEALPTIRNGLTGVGVWTALNLAKPVAYEENTLVLGLPHSEMELSGHLKMAMTRRLIEVTVGGLLKSPVNLRVIDGTDYSDWEIEKRRDAEKKRLAEQSMAKLRAELDARSNWEHIYEQLSRKYAAVPNKSLPQNKARFFEEAVAMLAEARQDRKDWDDLGERNFARCIERLSQYSDVPSTIVATIVLQKAGEL